ncbi:hypothetical protein NKOR_06425 [Candidatus Nitrosopumilus koreensis AR1]|uniref:Uncharacterized protein n=2 Tax=Nitrosopumilaceae TaxID=338190 RepID=K0B6P7_9ARCH|nr:hypothetical protein NKOR_06425 [Candidatus Nitrosopumilus koreensis AR1]
MVVGTLGLTNTVSAEKPDVVCRLGAEIATFGCSSEPKVGDHIQVVFVSIARICHGDVFDIGNYIWFLTDHGLNCEVGQTIGILNPYQ